MGVSTGGGGGVIQITQGSRNSRSQTTSTALLMLHQD